MAFPSVTMKIFVSLLALGASVDAFTGPSPASRASPRTATRLAAQVRPLTGGTEGSFILDDSYTAPSIDAPWGNNPVHRAGEYYSSNNDNDNNKGASNSLKPVAGNNPFVVSDGRAPRPSNGSDMYGMTGGTEGSGLLPGGVYGIVDHNAAFSDEYYKVQGIKNRTNNKQSAYFPMGLVPPGHREAPKAVAGDAAPKPAAAAPPAPAVQAVAPKEEDAARKDEAPAAKAEVPAEQMHAAN